MNKIYRNYIKSKGSNETSALGRYAQTADNDIANGYLLQKQEIQNNYQSEQEEQKQIAKVAEKIVKKIDDIFRDIK